MLLFFPDATTTYLLCGNAASLYFSFKPMDCGQTSRQVTDELNSTVICDICGFPLSNPQDHLNVVRNVCFCKCIVAEPSLEIKIKEQILNHWLLS